MAAGEVVTTLSEWLVVILIVFSLIFEVLLHRLEHWIGHKHHQMEAVLKVLYRELMILGVVSFGFIIYETVAKPSGDTVLSFEFAHVFIFLFAIFYTIVVLSTMFTSLRLSSRWKQMEQIDLVRYLHLKEQYTSLRLHVHKHHGAPWRWFWWWFPNFKKLWHYMQLHEMMAFHDIRFQFIFYRNLPEHFRFSSFLRKIKSVTFVHLVDSHWSLYVIFLGVVLCDLLRRYTNGSLDSETVKSVNKLVRADAKPEKSAEVDVVEQAIIIGAAILLMILVQILAVKIRQVYWKLTKNPRIYYEGVEATAVAEELAIAEARLQEERSNRRRSRSNSGLVEDSGNVADDEADVHRPSGDSPEAEMLDPMHLNIGQALGAPNPEQASPIYRPPSADNIPRELAAVNFRSENNRGVAPPNQMQSPFTDDQLAKDPELGNIAVRHSLDLKRAAPGDRSAGHSLEYNRSNRSPPQDVRLPMEFHETAARHSLDLPPNTVPSPAPQPVKTSREAFVAKAAVEAARKRSLEGQFGRRSLDSQITAESQATGTGQRLGDNPRLLGDPVRRIGSPRILSKLSSRGVSTDNDRGYSSSEYGRVSLDGKVRGNEKRSVELAAAMPRDEMVLRHELNHDEERDIEAGIVESTAAVKREAGIATETSSKPDTWVRFKGGADGQMNAGEASRPGLSSSQNLLQRYKSLGFFNATIVKNLEHHEKAKNMQPGREYPWIVKKLIPRLGRVASPVEKLFWFGSHKFFLWCVEFCLFFSTVLLAAATASLSLLAFRRDEVTGLHIASLVLSFVSLLFVLLRIAGIIKKYTFILHNASLVPEALAIEAIHRVSKKKRSPYRDFESSSLSGSDTEREEEPSAIERRKTLGRFFRSEAESGNMPGIEVGDKVDSRISADGGVRLSSRRKIALRRRNSRLRSRGQEIPSVPDR